jgi:plastocyanin
MPGSAQAGLTTIALKNTGAEEHQAQIAKLNDNVTLQQFQAALQNPNPSAALGLVVMAGGPTGVAPGATGVATTNMAPGNYVFLCFVPAPDGLPHIAKGMVAALQVTGTASSAQVPSTAVTVTAKDFSFEVPTTPLKAGKQTLTLNNTGPQPHEAFLVKLQAGVTVDQLKQQMSATPGPTGAASPPAGSPAAGGSPSTGGGPPWTSAGGVSGISANTRATFDVDLTAGNYAFLCFIPDPSSGRDHASLGMIAGVTVQ